MAWYDSLFCRVKWGDEFSEWFPITAGVRQGGVLSPDFYCIYVDDLLDLLRKSGKGCYFLYYFAAALFYADDMAILAPSVKGLTTLLEICGNYCVEFDICLNADKSQLMYFGKQTVVSFSVTLNGKALDWSNECKYLGVILKSGKVFGCSTVERVKKFYRCLNAILRIDGRSTDVVMLRLLETHCVPLLTYAIEIIHVCDRDERRQLRVAYNAIFRKIFGYRRSESVTALQHFLNRPTWEELIEKRRAGFVKRLRAHSQQSLAIALLK